MKDQDGLMEHERNAKFYFHGTGMNYLEKQISKYGKYQHDDLESGVEVFVSTRHETSTGYAQDRSNSFRDEPVVLKIDGVKVRGRVHQHPVVNDICIASLASNEYQLIHAPTK
jgi:hypothetical protein